MTAPEKSGAATGLQKKYGPLPLWVYIAVAGIIVLFLMYRKNAATKQTDTSQTDTMGQGQIPQFVNQVYTNTTPPDSSAPPTNTKPTSGAGPDRNLGKGLALDTPKTITFSEQNPQTYVELAHRLGLTAAQFGALNPALETKYYRSGKKIPKGTKIVTIPKLTPIGKK